MSLTILVLDDIEETRDGIEKLLKVDGYEVQAARGVEGAVASALRQRPDLILVSLGGATRDVIMSALSIRERAGLGAQVPVVIFCMEEFDDGSEVEIGQHVYRTCPDNFNQLRKFIARLMCESAGQPVGLI